MTYKIRPVAAPPKGWQHLMIHPLAELAHVEADVEAIAAHMQEFGYDEREPLILLRMDDGEGWWLFDGILRREAAIKAEEEPSFAEISGNDHELRGFIRKKLLRQHLDTSQRAFVAAGLADAVAGGQQAERSQKTTFSTPLTNAKVAALMNVSETSVDRAKSVHSAGSPRIQRAVRVGQVKVTDAAAVMHLPHEEQDAALDRLAAGEVRTLVEAIEGPVLCKQCKKRPVPVRNCPACDEARALKRIRGGEPTVAEKPRPQTAAKSKGPPFAWGRWRAAITALLELADALARREKKTDTPEHKSLLEAVREADRQAGEMEK